MSQPPLPVPQGPPPKPPQKNQSFPIETVFFVMIAMNLLPRGQAVDAAHARNAALFRLAMTVIGVTGLIVTFIVKRLKAANAPSDALPVVPPQQGVVNPWDQAAAWQGLVIPYVMTRQSALRHELIALRRTPTVLSLLFMPVFFTFLTVAANWNKISASAMVGKAALVFFGAAALLGGLGVLMFFVRFPKADSVRRCVVYLSRDGIQDVLPDKTIMLAWSAIGKVVEQDGDLFFSPAPGNTLDCSIPREAFTTREAGQRFYRAALTLWETRGATMPSEDVLQEFGPHRPETAVSAAPSTPPAALVPGFDLSAD